MRATAPAYGAPGGYGAPYNGGGGMRANAPAYGAGGGYNQGYGGGMRANAPAYGGGYAGGGGYNGGMRANAPAYQQQPQYLAPGGLQANHPLLMRRPPPQAYAAPQAYSHSAPPANGGYAHSAPPAANAGAAALRDSAHGAMGAPAPPGGPRTIRGDDERRGADRRVIRPSTVVHWLSLVAPRGSGGVLEDLALSNPVECDRRGPADDASRRLRVRSFGSGERGKLAL